MEIVADFACHTGECPVWHAAEQALYWVDIPRGIMYRFDPASSKSEAVYSAAEQIGGLAVQADGSILQFLEEGRTQIWRDGEVTPVCAGIPEDVGTRFNDAIADPMGRVLVGTMPGPSGHARLYRFDPDGRPEMLLDRVGLSNGMVFNRGGTALFHTDTRQRTIRRYAYDVATGTLGDSEIVVCTGEDEGFPDGLEIDDADVLWSAQWGGSCIACYSIDGRELDRIAFPTEQVSSVAFGGSDYLDAYITTAGGQDRGRYGPSAGALFRLRCDVPGRAPFLSQVALR